MNTNDIKHSNESTNDIDQLAKQSRLELCKLARAINDTLIVDDDGIDWVQEFGKESDKTNNEAIATWISRQSDIFENFENHRMLSELRRRFELTVGLWLMAYKYNCFDFDRVITQERSG